MDNDRCVIVEVGNSVTELALLEGESCLARERVPTAGLQGADDVRRVIDSFSGLRSGLRSAAVSSVVPRLTALFVDLLSVRLEGDVLEISSALDLPFRFEYFPRTSIGADRLALLAFGAGRASGRAVIVVDLGTAVTIDVLDRNATYRGGMILPGIDLQRAALHERTARLPLVDIGSDVPLLGRSTEECIRSGILYGCARQVDGLIGDIRSTLPVSHGKDEPLVVVTGGSSRIIAPMLHCLHETDEHAVLKGAALLLELNRTGR
ncbi:type III pantothenate kinase [Prosthecochloris sp. N3]|uniref:Type III pantothenate kinase n=1 Tax=Prosthecochloris ethylica TaxID=2743976 RepID=A0ABR9XR72_9CHLB|nr:MULTISPECIES: type III pantothenate kinase [Prosthecochloris]MBF0585524.1 type III pantothenate kinase [Prosthecochloris ethylica]MBF0636310.1 type III pantothenate kinase [Prosthecochloris ethylica]NUK46754.1 type III pantothenate kinase [Prosthecochloris ethylica]